MIFQLTTPTKNIWNWLAAALSLVVVECGIPKRPQEITVSKAPDFRPARPTDVHSVEQALAAIATVCRDDLHLPVVDPLQVDLYKNTASYAFYGYGWRTLPFDVAHQVAFARKNEIHIDLEKIGGDRAPSVRLLAHEYAHTINHEITGEQITSLFAAEGFADWVAARVLHSLGWQDYDITLHRARREVIRQWDRLPEIPVILHPDLWKRTLDQANGSIRTYNLAFLTMDKIVQQKGIAGAIDFLQNASFQTAFGMTADIFDAELKKSLLQVPSPSKDPFTIGRPDWRIGYKWTYLTTTSGNSATVVKEIIGEDRFHGVQVFVVRTGEEEALYGKKGLGFVASRRDGKVISEVDLYYPFFVWPLEPAKEFRIWFRERNLTANSITNYSQVRLVAGIEKIHVGAGDFDAVKVEIYKRPNGRLQAEYWYAPQAKWFVKTRVYGEFGVNEEQLLRVDLADSDG